MLTRRANIDITYLGVNITKNISSDLKSFSYTDNASGTADDINISLKDDKSKWISSWAPTKGDSIVAKIYTTNWRYEGDSQNLVCGSFMIDNLDYSGRPRTLSLGAISMPANSGFCSTEKSKTWKDITLKSVVSDIAFNAGLELYFDTSIDVKISFLEQSEIADKTFLYDLCSKYGYSIKIFSNKIIIFREEEYESKSAIDTLHENDMLSWSVQSTLTNTAYTASSIKYHDPNSGSDLKYIYSPINDTSKVIECNESVKSYAEAEIIAKSKLREANKKENTITLSIPGNLILVASGCVNVSGLGGKFDGKYFIDRATHNLDGGLITELELHMVLGGY